MVGLVMCIQQLLVSLQGSMQLGQIEGEGKTTVALREGTDSDHTVMYLPVELYLQGSALLGGINVLHSAFPSNADEEYRTQGMSDYRGCMALVTIMFL